MLANLRALFGVFADIMLLRRGPDHLPASPPLLAVLVVLNFVLYSIASTVVLPADTQAANPWLVQFASIALLLAWFRVTLMLLRKSERYVQTMIAVFGVNLLAFPALPLFAALMPYAAQKPEAEPAPALLSLTVLAVAFWFAAVLVRIVKSAFEWPWFAAIVFMLSTGFGILIMLGLIFGTTPKAA